MSSTPLPALLIRARLEIGKVIPFLGAGASLAERNPKAQAWNPADPTFLPTSDELANLLGKAVNYPLDEDTMELTKVAKYYELMAGRDVLDENLHTVFARPAQYGKIHRALAANPKPLLIITTNYDDMMERALADAKRPFDVVIHLTTSTLKKITDHERADSMLWHPDGKELQFATDDDLAAIDMTNRFVVYKMHGSFDRDREDWDSYVITEDDYIDFLTRMTSAGASAIPSFVAKQLARSSLLFLGYGLRDWNLRVLLHQIDQVNKGRSINSWAVQYNPSRVEKQFWSKRDVAIFNLKVDEFVDQMQRN